MVELNFDALKLSITALEQGLEEHAQYPQLLTVRDGVIQRFEVAIDISQKLIRRVLQEVYQMEPARIAKNAMREAAGMALIADAERWIGHIDARNEISRTCDTSKAEAVFERIPGFLPDARDLLKRLINATA
ncbi:nucleotidyltransferase substrate binding protein [Verminephrobacter eiseniae]|uniref:nucleotidyltransferase substrate binding protein n=1 Tax=Verminephrobacter eiseniae TaxID=364317 RepID=UPI002237676E|nr:nucleotidyltransferase substrate binding protein [Verminephrobacter eiseniae]MCW5238318.1 nucleotidyltransferase [Verminephrobacter eiseniae]